VAIPGVADANNRNFVLDFVQIEHAFLTVSRQ
jgi:hypothetical protein